MDKDSDEELEDETLSNSAVVEKYKIAGTICNTVMAALIAKAKVGVRIVELCEAGDALILEETGKLFRKNKAMKKGIAFPTCVSLNNTVGHFNPAAKDDKTVIQEGDVVKIDFGVHMDGYINTAAHTIIATDNPAEPVTGKKADVVCAAYFAAEAALRLLRPGNSNKEVTEVLAKVAKDFGVSVVEGVLSHNLKRFVIDGNDVILSREAQDQRVETVQFRDYQVWNLDVIMSTGEGKPKLGDAKSTVFKRNADEKYNLKQASSRELLNHVTKVYDTLAWCHRSVKDAVGPKVLLGLKEMTEHNLINEYPVLVERNKEVVAQFKFTVLILPNKIEKLNTAPLPYVTTDKKVEDEGVKATLELPLLKKKLAQAEEAPQLVEEPPK